MTENLQKAAFPGRQQAVDGLRRLPGVITPARPLKPSTGYPQGQKDPCCPSHPWCPFACHADLGDLDETEEP